MWPVFCGEAKSPTQPDAVLATRIRPTKNGSNDGHFALVRIHHPSRNHSYMITKATLSPPTPDNLPVLSSDDLEITSWERLGHGGHSYVFLVTIPGRSPSVVKIFRFNLERADPYLHFRRESTSYSLLCRAGLLGTVVPAVHGVLRISPSHEAALAAEEKLGGLQAMRYRVRSATAPLMAVWMEFVPGRRLSRDDVGVSVRAEGVTCGLDKIHDAGVLQGDVKWRNIMVADDADRGVVWIDFSTSDAHDDGSTDQSWQEKLQVEKNKLEDMLGRYRQVRTRFFLFFFCPTILLTRRVHRVGAQAWKEAR